MKHTCKISWLILGIALSVSLYIRIAAVWGNNFPFTMDQGRDMVDLRHMIVTTSPRLIGPTTSINGVFLGPAWYYFLLPAFVLGGGDPSVIMIWQIIWYQLSGLFLWWVFSKKSLRLGLIVSLLFLFAPVGFNTSRYFWNANAMPIFTAFFFGTLLMTLEKTSFKKLILTGILAGIGLQIEAAFGILFFPFAFLYLAAKRLGIKNLLMLSLGFVSTLIPQAIFELRHDFLMTKVLLAEFSGKATILGEKITFSDRLGERWQELIRRIVELSHFHPNIILLLFFFSLVIGIFILIKSKQSVINRISSVSIFFLIFSALFYLGFPQHLKGWYVLGLSVPLILIIASSLEYLFNLKNKYLSPIITVTILLHILHALSAQSEYLNQIAFTVSNDPSNLRNELTAIDWVYTKANGNGFKAYSYIPSVYDYNYHYLYWWYGAKKYGYHPLDVAYLPNQTEYIKDNALLWTKAKAGSNEGLIFLIIETDKEMSEREQKWLGNFSKLCPIEENKYPFGVETVMTRNCPD